MTEQKGSKPTTKEVIAKVSPEAAAMVNNSGDFWNGVANNTLTTEQLRQSIELSKMMPPTDSRTVEAAKAVLKLRGEGKLDTPDAPAK